MFIHFSDIFLYGTLCGRFGYRSCAVDMSMIIATTGPGTPCFSAAGHAGGDGPGRGHCRWTGAGTGHASQRLCAGHRSPHFHAADLAGWWVVSL